MIVIETGTDVAMIGIWDFSVPRDDLGKSNPKAFQSLLEEDARSGKVIYVNTFSDGSYPIGLCFDRGDLPSDLSSWYKQVSGNYFINVNGGQILVGGLEDYRSSKPQITSESNVVPVESGSYRVFPYCYDGDEERMLSEIKEIVGAEEYEYFSSQSKGCLMVLAFLAVGLAAAFLLSWWWMVPALAIGITYLIYRNRVNAKDARFMSVQHVIENWESNHPALLFLFERTDRTSVSDCFFELNFEAAKQGD